MNRRDLLKMLAGVPGLAIIPSVKVEEVNALLDEEPGTHKDKIEVHGKEENIIVEFTLHTADGNEWKFRCDKVDIVVERMVTAPDSIHAPFGYGGITKAEISAWEHSPLGKYERQWKSKGMVE